MLNTVFEPWPSFEEDEIAAVEAVLRSNRVNYWTGSLCREFENEFAVWCGANHAIALANGTLALELALRGLGVGVGDEVVVTPRSFMASVSCVVAVGATPVFADVEFNAGNLSAETIAQVLTSKTKAVICVHLGGMPCDMDPIMALAQKHGFYVIEDCAQAHGARYKGKSVGSIGHVAAWSFCQDKIMTTGGEGGMVTTNDTDLWSKMWSYKDHGKDFKRVYAKDHPDGFRWLHDSFGSNWRMIEMQAAIGLCQLKKMDQWHKQRTKIAQVYANSCRSIPSLRLTLVPDDSVHAYYRFYVYLAGQEGNQAVLRDKIVQDFQKANIPCFVGSCPEIYREKAFDDTSWRPEKSLPIAKQLGETCFAFLVHPTLSDMSVTKIAQKMHEIFSLQMECV
jgi:dTDP-4-amino-4,6-dideoxygalactose transaminase